MSDKNTEKLDEFKDASNVSAVAEPTGTGNTHANRKADKANNKEATPHLDTKDGPSSKVEVMNWITNYVAGLDQGTAMDFYAKLKAEYAAKDATNGGNNKGVSGNEHNRSTIVAKEELESIFASDESLSEDFKTKISTIFEATLAVAVNTRLAELEEENEKSLDEVTTVIIEELTEKVDAHMARLSEKWLEENRVAVESTLRLEASDSFMESLKVAFAEHYVNIPADKADVFESLTNEIESIEEKYNAEVETVLSLKNEINSIKAAAVLESKIANLTDTQKEKVRKLAEEVNTSSEDYVTKIDTLVEAVATKAVSSKQLNENSLSDVVESEEKTPVYDPQMNHYVQSISRTTKR